MVFNIEKLPKSMVKIVIELTDGELQVFKDRAISDIGRNLNLPGFRPGHIPKEMVESKVGADLIFGEVVEKAIPKTYADIVLKENIKVVAKPEINIIEREPFKFEVKVAVLPEVKFSKDPKTIKLPKEKVELTDKDYQENLDELLDSYAELKDTDQPAQTGDKLEINFTGFDEEGKIIEGTESKNHPVVIGKKTLIEDFEKQLIGLKTGETKEFEVVFPKDYHKKDFQNKKVRFKVDTVRVQNVIKPKFDDEFVKKLSIEYVSVVDFEEKFKKRLLESKEEQAKIKRENLFLDELVKIAEMEIPDALIEEEVEHMISDFKSSLLAKGIKWEHYEEHLQKENENLQQKYRPEAEKHIKLRIALNELFELNKIEINDKDLEEEIEKITKIYPENHKEEIINYYNSDKQARLQLSNRLRIDRLFAVYLD